MPKATGCVPFTETKWVKFFASHLLHAVYGIKLKWEPSSDFVTWGVGTLGVREGLPSLRRKGVPLTLHYPNPKWENWIDGFSPRAKFVWRSPFLSLLSKCSWYALTPHDIRDNLRSLIWGIRVKRYPGHWWLGTLKRCYKSSSLARIVCMHILRPWVYEGKVSKC